MPKFIITWDAGFGEQAEIVEAADQAAAERMADDALQEDLSANYRAGTEPYNRQRAIELGLEEEEETDQCE